MVERALEEYDFQQDLGVEAGSVLRKQFGVGPDGEKATVVRM